MPGEVRRVISDRERARLKLAMVQAAEKRACRSYSSLARQFKINRQTIRNWMADDKRFGEELDFALAGVKRETGGDVPDFETFRKECFGHETFAHQEEWIKAVDENRRTLILVPPNHAKTFTWAIEYPVWRICQDPNVRIIIVCKNQDVAKKRLYAIKKRLSDTSWYRANDWRNPIVEWGPFAPTSGERSDNPWTQTLIYVRGADSAEKDPTVEVLGVGNQIQGARADLIILDDIVDSKNQASETTVSNITDWFFQEVNTRLEPNDTSKVIIIGTRVHEADFYAPLLSEDTDWAKDFARVVQPAILDEENQTVLWPERWPYDKLAEQRAGMPPRLWALTYQQQAVGMPGAPFSPEMIERCKDPSYAVGHVPPGLPVVMGVDPAVQGNAAITVLAVDRQTKERFVLDCTARSELSNTDMLKAFIIENAAKYRASRCRIEQNFLRLNDDLQLRRELLALGCQMEYEWTDASNKYDDQWGILSVAAAFDAGLYHLPWGYGSNDRMQPLIDELLVWRPVPQSKARRKQDRVISIWLAELSARQYTSYRPGLPTKRNTPLWARRKSVPRWVANRDADRPSRSEMVTSA